MSDLHAQYCFISLSAKVGTNFASPTSGGCSVGIVRSRTQATEFSCYTVLFQESMYVIGKTDSVALVREQTIPTERPPLVGEISAKFLRIEGVSWST
jgi:hypothetical protein